MLEELEPIALGELRLTIVQFGECTVGQINALTRAYIRRRDALEDMFIVYSALPTYQTQLKKPPTYEKLTAHRRTRKAVMQNKMSPDEISFWHSVLEEAQR